MPTSKKVAPPKTRQGARNGGAVAPRKPRRAARNAGAVGTSAGAGGVAGGLTTGTTAGPAGGVIRGETATSAHSEFDTLGWFIADTEGVKVRFGIDAEEYFLDATATNYNAVFSMLLACWLEHRRVQIVHATDLLNPVLAPDAPRRILSVVAF